jgi:predicted butyrate kinase (DUF1464 family)
VVKEVAPGAALTAEGLGGSRHKGLVQTMCFHQASGTVQNHLHVTGGEALTQSTTKTWTVPDVVSCACHVTSIRDGYRKRKTS